MSDPLQARLREFTRALLERRGALVEWPADSPEGIAVLPQHVSESLRLPETVRLSHDPGGADLCANLATDFLDHVRPLIDAEPRVGDFQIPELYLKKAAMDEPVARAFAWPNAKVRVQAAEPARAEYHTWHFAASLSSDDRWEQILPVTVNSLSGAVVDLPPPETAWTFGPKAEPGCAPARTYRNAVRAALAEAESRSAAFIARLESRRDRDRVRLRGYYHALLREAADAASRHWRRLGGTAGGTDAASEAAAQEKQAARNRAVELELDRKLAELDERYAVRGELAPLVLLRTEMPVLAIHCQVFRKQSQRTHTLYWNPLAKKLEPMCCGSCGASAFAVSFTDTDVKPLCPACAR